MHPRDCSIREAVTRDVPCHKAVAAQSVYGLAHHAWHLLFLCVRPRLTSSLSSALCKHINLIFCHSIFLSILIGVLGGAGSFPTGGWTLILLFTLQYLPIYTLTSRFILNIRKLYARDARGRRGEGIDTGFGLSLSGRDAVGTAMVFANVGQNEGSGDVEEIQMQVQPE